MYVYSMYMTAYLYIYIAVYTDLAVYRGFILHPPPILNRFFDDNRAIVDILTARCHRFSLRAAARIISPAPSSRMRSERRRRPRYHGSGASDSRPCRTDRRTHNVAKVIAEVVSAHRIQEEVDREIHVVH